ERGHEGEQRPRGGLCLDLRPHHPGGGGDGGARGGFGGAHHAERGDAGARAGKQQHGPGEEAHPGRGEGGGQGGGDTCEGQGEHRGGAVRAEHVHALRGAGEVRGARLDPGGAGGAGQECGGRGAGEHGGAAPEARAAGGGVRRAHAGRSVSAAAAARSAAAAFDWVSRCSMVASESATTPPPAWTCAVPSLITAVRMAIAMSMSPAKSKYPTVPP